jgi:hypothetical protein
VHHPSPSLFPDEQLDEPQELRRWRNPQNSDSGMVVTNIDVFDFIPASDMTRQ